MDQIVDLTQLTNGELIQRYRRIVFANAPAEVEAARDVLMINPDGFLPVPDREVIIDYLKEEEPSYQNNNNPKFRRTNGGKRRRKTRRGRKSRKSRKNKKSRRR